MTEIPEHLRKRAEEARAKAAAAKAEEAAPAAEAGDAAAEGDSKIPAHLLERAKAARAKAGGIQLGSYPTTGAATPEEDPVEKLAKAKVMLDQNLISEAEYDRAVLLHSTATNRIKTIMEEEEARWESALTQLRMKVRELESQDQQYLREKDFYEVKAPISGTIQQLKGLQPGSIVAANEMLAEISPDEAMVAEMYSDPSSPRVITIDKKA